MSDLNLKTPCSVNNTSFPLFDRFAFGRPATTLLAELTESLFEGRIQRRVWDERTSNVSIGIVVGQGDERCLTNKTLTQNEADKRQSVLRLLFCLLM